MRIAIVGAGNVGRSLAQRWHNAGHAVTFAVRNEMSPGAERARAGGMPTVPLGHAAGDAEVIVLAVPWQSVPEAIASLGDVSGRIVVDTTNPLTADLELAVGFDDSAGEGAARLAKGAHVVKAFNTTGADNMAEARAFPVKPMMPVAGDDAGAKHVVMRLAAEIGFEPIDAGPLKESRLLEPMAMFWIKQAIVQKAGRNFAFAVTHR